MKYFYILVVSILATGCVKKSTIEFTGSTPGVKNGVFIIKDVGDSTVYGENIKDGKFSLAPKRLGYPGFYKMSITNNDSSNTHGSFEIYLEPGKYTVETAVGKFYNYPKITSPSKIQEELSAYYAAVDRLDEQAKVEKRQLNAQVDAEEKQLSAGAFTKLLNKVSAIETKSLTNNGAAFKEFIKQYPNSEISAHLMAKIDYETDPVEWYAVYKTLGTAAKNSDDGKEIGEKLSHLVKLIPGVASPAITGTTPDGKPFNEDLIRNKLILVDFWRASNEISRRNHERMTKMLETLKDKNQLGIISVSIDNKRDWWISAVAEDHMTWPQVSDLKGDDSPIAANWAVSKIPTYYLIDSNHKIIERDIDINRLGFVLLYHLQKKH